jgi:hypothetical protein
MQLMVAPIGEDADKLSLLPAQYFAHELTSDVLSKQLNGARMENVFHLPSALCIPVTVD